MARRKTEKNTGKEADHRFRDELMALIDWVASVDPMKAARLLGDYVDEVTEEMMGDDSEPCLGC